MTANHYRRAALDALGIPPDPDYTADRLAAARLQYFATHAAALHLLRLRRTAAACAAAPATEPEPTS